MTIISFQNKFIFIKTRKTAGTSLEIHLGDVCGPNDIVTPINPPNPAHQPRNYGNTYRNHMSADNIKRCIPDQFGEFYKFCFERHPVDKCISQYAWRKNASTRLDSNASQTWENYLERGDFPIDTDKYCTVDGKLMVDRIYRYEEMDKSIRDIEQRLNVQIGAIAAREKSGFRTDAPTMAEVMNDPRQKNRIMNAFAGSLRITPYD